MKTLTWNKFPPKPFYGTIKDWNQTLVTILNIASGGIDVEANVVISENCKSIIYSLYYYNKEKSVIGDRFFVSFTNKTKDIIICNSTQIQLNNE